MDYISIVNWEKFQAMKHRNPPWIRLHYSLFDNYEFSRLTDNEKLTLMFLWMLASKLDNKITADLDWLKKKMGVGYKIKLDNLVSQGFIEVCTNVSESIQVNTNVTTEQYSTVQSSTVQSSTGVKSNSQKKLKQELIEKRFEEFWNVFNYKDGKAPAFRSWKKIAMDQELFQQILTGAKATAQARPKLIKLGRTPKMAQGWLTDNRWEDEVTSGATQTFEPGREPDKFELPPASFMEPPLVGDEKES